MADEITVRRCRGENAPPSVERLDPNFAQFERRAFKLKSNGSRRRCALGHMILKYAIDPHLNVAPATNDVAVVPFTSGFLAVSTTEVEHGCLGISWSRQWFGELCASHRQEVSCTC